MYLRNVPMRLATGAFILNSGIEKWSGGREQAEAVHGMASNAFGVVKDIDPTLFLRGLSVGEVALGAALLSPTVSSVRAGVALTAFSGGLLAVYLKTPALRKPNSVRPSQAGLGVSKDVWMFSIGLGLVLGGAREKAGDAASSVSDAASSVSDAMSDAVGSVKDAVTRG